MRPKRIVIACVSEMLTGLYGKVPGVTKVKVLRTDRSKAQGEVRVTFDPS